MQQHTHLVRWGHYGMPLLLFPTAAGDAEECERFRMIDRLSAFIQDGRLKVYSVNSIAGRTWLMGDHSVAHRAWVQNQFDAYIYHEVVPAIRADCQSHDIQLLTAGASIGAFNALASICRHPDVFCRAIGMSGTYDFQAWLGGQWLDDFYYSSPIHYLPGLNDGEQLQLLRERFIILAFAGGRWEDPGETWKLAHVLGSKGVPNRVDPWGPEWDHDWPTWREMLPAYVDEMLRSCGY